MRLVLMMTRGVAYFAYSAARIIVKSEVYASVCAVDSPLTEYQKTCNAKFIYKRLVNCGFTKNAACAVLGNMERESKLNPGIWQILNNTELGYGLVQWSPAGTKFLKWASDHGVIPDATTASTINDFALRRPKDLTDAELTYLIYYTDSREFYPPNKPQWHHTDYSMSFADFKKSTLNTDILAIIFNDHFERSGDDLAAIKKYRCASAIKWFNKL